MDTLRFIVSELNKDLNRDFNMISFDSLSDTELIQVLIDILAVQNATSQLQVHKNKEQAIMNIMSALQSIKYVPETDVSVTVFRDGLIKGRRAVIHPILHWILSNKEKVKQRIYFATFVEKVEVPPELLSDFEIDQMNRNYDKLIEEFWTSYNEHAKDIKDAAESAELQEDTKKMSTDMSYLLQRLDQQSEKLKNVPNREAVISSVKSYRNETQQKERLQDQLRDQRNFLVTMDSEIKTLLAALRYNQGRRPQNIDPITQLREELQINSILAEGQLPREYDETTMELQVFEMVAQDAEPTQTEVDELNVQMAELNRKVQVLLNNKLALTNTDSDQLLPFRNQATIIANKKEDLSHFVMETKNKNDSLVELANEKLRTLRALVGGDVLHGDELKLFINKLREQSAIYKNCRMQVQALQTSVGILTRTKEILQQEDPTVEERWNQRNAQHAEGDDLQGDDVAALKAKYKMLCQDANDERTQSESVHSVLLQLRSEYNNFTDLFFDTKRKFNNTTGNLTGDIERLEETSEALEVKIKKDEDEWKETTKSIENYEMIIQRYSDEIAMALGSEQIIERLHSKLRSIERQMKDVRNKLEHAKQLKNIEQEELEQFQRIKQMLFCKLQLL